MIEILGIDHVQGLDSGHLGTVETLVLPRLGGGWDRSRPPMAPALSASFSPLGERPSLCRLPSAVGRPSSCPRWPRGPQLMARGVVGFEHGSEGARSQRDRLCCQALSQLLPGPKWAFLGVPLKGCRSW